METNVRDGPTNLSYPVQVRQKRTRKSRTEMTVEEPWKGVGVPPGGHGTGRGGR